MIFGIVLKMSSLKNKAIETALSGDWNGAIELNKEMLKEDPNDVEALNRIGLAYTILGKIDDARSSYQKVLEIDSLNSIAIKNLKKFTKDVKVKNVIPIRVNNTFLEESGKTKVVDLINLAPHTILSNLKTGQTIELSIKRSKLFVLNDEREYIGMLPDDLGRRLLKFMSGGNKYEAYIRSSNGNGVTVFIREIKRATRYKDNPSFIGVSEKTLDFAREKNKKRFIKKVEKNYEEEVEESDSSADEEE